jgi:membrane fusion protein (multidrug efflux system)
VRQAVMFGDVFARFRSRFRRWAFPASMALVLALAVSGCEKKDEKRPMAGRGPTEVTVVTIASGDVPVTTEYIAQIQSSRLVNIQARVDGFLDRRVYTEGEVVKEGQTLFLMDPKPFKVQLDQAKAALAGQEAACETARANLARVKPLTQLNALSQKDLDDAVGQFHTAEAAVAQAKAEVESAKLKLSYTTITSPVNGITSSAQQTDGTYINQQNSLLTTVSVLSPMWVNFSLSENQMQKIHTQMAKGLLRMPKDGNFLVEVVLPDGSLFPYTGKITFAEPSYNPQTGTFLIRASVDNPDGQLRANQYVRARVKGVIRPNAILIPQRAVQQGPKGHFAWVVSKENQAQMRPIDVGDWYESDWFIDEGLQAGEQVVVDGVLALRPGAPVTTKPYLGTQEPTASRAPHADTGKTEPAGGGK